MRHRDKTIKSIGELIRALAGHSDGGNPVWFRGQSDKAWGLSPSLVRDAKAMKAEAALMKRFKQNAVPHLSERPQDEWEWLFLMQHYRLPTRLLDWSESPLVALYFAVRGDSHGEPAALWCLDPVALNEMANVKFEFAVDIPAFGDDECLNGYLPSQIARERTSTLNPMAGIALRNSTRIAAQMGTFTVTHRNVEPINELGECKHVWRYLIPNEVKKQILLELRRLRINALSLFPELDKVADSALEVME